MKNAQINSFDTAAMALYTKPNTSLNGGKIFNREEAEKTAKDFEAFFISRMMESMFEGVSTDGMFGGGQAEKVYRSLLINEYGKAMAKTGSIGVADEVMRSIIEMQEMASQGYINGSKAN